tara:strand:- start:4822 stop:5871 length:1050 start_codon:yes stop_codon:yes gene_type:complete
MIHGIFGLYDTTLYQSKPTTNTGLDSVLSLSKQAILTSSYNNRILLKFDISSISQSVADNTITNAQYYLNLYTVEAQEVPTTYTVEVYPVSGTWTSGIGKYSNTPTTTYGASWLYRDSSPLGTASWDSGVVGGLWNTAYGCSQSYDYSSTDVRVNVTPIVNAWINGVIPNNGFLIKKSNYDETGSYSLFGQLNYFSSDTHTIYLPKLEVAWDSATFTTGSLTQPQVSKDITVYIKNLKKAYKETSKARLNVGVREKYPVITFATQSNFLEINYLPSSSFFYSIQHADTQETVIPFDTNYTKVSCDSNGNFVNLWMDGLQPERYYKILFRVDRGGAQEYVDNNYIFKIIK